MGAGEGALVEWRRDTFLPRLVVKVAPMSIFSSIGTVNILPNIRNCNWKFCIFVPNVTPVTKITVIYP